MPTRQGVMQVCSLKATCLAPFPSVGMWRFSASSIGHSHSQTSHNINVTAERNAALFPAFCPRVNVQEPCSCDAETEGTNDSQMKMDPSNYFKDLEKPGEPFFGSKKDGSSSAGTRLFRLGNPLTKNDPSCSCG
ncbi:hypothetical protein BaRGS_00032556 [Batillaria attramentaria]|uniref:Uncharacterized protein n=1 Tax=Batillaria attramentaria TaxID=370345 RepID=A0ABD0JMS7_9CAEN